MTTYIITGPVMPSLFFFSMNKPSHFSMYDENRPLWSFYRTADEKKNMHFELGYSFKI